MGGSVTEFTVCPPLKPNGGLPSHEWFIEFSKKPNNLDSFQDELNREMIKQNIYYKDLINSGVIGGIRIRSVISGGFDSYMNSIGKLGGQNKCPHLSNERIIANFLIKSYVEK